MSEKKTAKKDKLPPCATLQFATSLGTRNDMVALFYNELLQNGDLESTSKRVQIKLKTVARNPVY